jgi:trehalose 6-phosphate synthase
MRSSEIPLTIVANRLPFYSSQSGEWKSSPGGLARVLKTVIAKPEAVWVGWAGRYYDDIKTDRHTHQVPNHGPFSCHELLLERKDYRRYYEGWSNSGLWPLYHGSIRQPLFHAEDYKCYEEVNQKFAERVATIAPLNGFVWVHDYQLQLVPLLLRRLRPDLRIGFFLHIPFPSIELLVTCPCAGAMLEGLLGSDLLGFQTLEYAENFLAATSQLLGHKSTSNQIMVHSDQGNRSVNVEVFPIGVYAKGLNETAKQTRIRAMADDLRRSLGKPQTMILGLDRLDYTKGIDIRMRAVAELLSSGELDIESTLFMQVSMETRGDIECYQILKKATEQLVETLNSGLAFSGEPRIRHACKSLSHEELVSTYLAADIMLVTPYSDGMNIVCKEFVACREDASGALVLSRRAGAAEQLRQAWLVDPYDIESIKKGILSAVRASSHDCSQRMSQMRANVFEHDARWWADSFVRRLLEKS